MDAGKIELLLASLGCDTGKTHRTSKWVQGECPAAFWLHKDGTDNNPSFGIAINEGGRSYANCYSCGTSGDLEGLVNVIAHHQKMGPKKAGMDLPRALELVDTEDELTDMEGLPDYEQLVHSKYKKTEIITFPEYWLDSFDSWRNHERARHYILEVRGIKAEVADKYELRYDPHKDRVCFPTRTDPDTVVGLHSRYIGTPDAKNPRYFAYGYQGKRNPDPWFGEQFVSFKKPVILFEGNFDLLKVAAIHPNVLCGQGSKFTEGKVSRLKKAEKLYSWFDYGKAGDMARAKLDKMLPHHDITHIVPSEEEDDAANTSYDEIQRAIDEFVED